MICWDPICAKRRTDPAGRDGDARHPMTSGAMTGDERSWLARGLQPIFAVPARREQESWRADSSARASRQHHEMPRRSSQWPTAKALPSSTPHSARNRVRPAPRFHQMRRLAGSLVLGPPIRAPGHEQSEKSAMATAAAIDRIIAGKVHCSAGIGAAMRAGRRGSTARSPMRSPRKTAGTTRAGRRTIRRSFHAA